MFYTAIKMILKVGNKVFTKSLTDRIVSKILSTPTLGRIAFNLSILIKRLSLFRGSWSQKAIDLVANADQEHKA